MIEVGNIIKMNQKRHERDLFASSFFLASPLDLERKEEAFLLFS